MASLIIERTCSTGAASVLSPDTDPLTKATDLRPWQDFRVQQFGSIAKQATLQAEDSVRGGGDLWRIKASVNTNPAKAVHTMIR